MNKLTTCCLVFLLLCSSCTTTKTSIRDAAALAKMLKKYRTQQEDHLEHIGKEYQQAYDRLIKENDELIMTGALTRMDLDALRLSDKMVADWKQSTLPSKFRDNFETDMHLQVDRMAQAEQATQKARENYAAAYHEIVLKMAEIKSVEVAMQRLSTSRSKTAELEDLIKKLYAAYQAGNAGTNAQKK